MDDGYWTMTVKVDFSRGVTAGWGATGDNWIVLRGRTYKRDTKPLIVWIPSHAAGVTSVLSGGLGIMWAEWGYPVVCLDFGSGATWGVLNGVCQWTNDTALAAMNTCRDVIGPAIGALDAPLGIAAGSAGAALGAKWAHDNPTDCFGCLFIIGAVDLEDVRVNDRLPPATITITNALGAPVPEVRNPAMLAATWPDDIPVWHLYSSGDTICIPQITQDWCEEVNDGGGNAIATQQNTNNHDYYTGLPAQEAVGWLIAQA